MPSAELFCMESGLGVGKFFSGFYGSDFYGYEFFCGIRFGGDYGGFGTAARVKRADARLYDVFLRCIACGCF